MYCRSLHAAMLAAVLLFAACGGDGAERASADGAGAQVGEQVTLRLGYFPNITHATALVGVERGIFADALGAGVSLETQTFNAGPEAVEALFSGSLDATYIGPNPAINAFVKSGGQAIRIIAGATSGGAFLVVRPDIDSVADLAGATLATPQLGNTQDVALRAWLLDKGLSADTSGGGDVSILPQPNGETLEAFARGAIDGAWVPEPWATRLIEDVGAHVLVDERDLWPDGDYVTTLLVVRTAFLDEHPDVVKRLLEGHVAATDHVNADTADARAAANDRIEQITQKRIADEVMAAAWMNLTFTNDPLAGSLQAGADAAHAVGLLDEVDLREIYALELLNEVLAETSAPAVTGL